MQLFRAVLTAFAAVIAVSAQSAPSTAGIEALLNRRFAKHAGNIQFEIINSTTQNGVYDQYSVSSISNGTILVQGNTLSGLATG